MTELENDEERPGGVGHGFCHSRSFYVLLGFLAVAGVLLAYEHRVHIFTGTGLLFLIVLLCPAMHFFMHGGHGGHGGHGSHHNHDDTRDRQ